MSSKSANSAKDDGTGWTDKQLNNLGKRIFQILIVMGLVFYWWMIFYDHGVAPHGG